jgi:hypothetical protein
MKWSWVVRRYRRGFTSVFCFLVARILLFGDHQNCCSAGDDPFSTRLRASRAVASSRRHGRMGSGSRLGEYRRDVQARYAPVISVVCTDEAEAACGKSGHRLADLLQQFAHVKGMHQTIQPNPETPPYVLTEFPVRFVSLDTCVRVTHEQSEAHAQRAFALWDGVDDARLGKTLGAIPNDVVALRARHKAACAAGSTGDDEHTERSAVDDGLSTSERKALNPNPDRQTLNPNWFRLPWFRAFASRLRRATAFSEFESVDHPKGCVFAHLFVPGPGGPDQGDDTHDQLLIQTLAKLAAPYYENPQSYPPLIRSEAADPDAVKHFVVLVEKENGASGASGSSGSSGSVSQTTRKKLNERFGECNVTVLPINSSGGRKQPPGGFLPGSNREGPGGTRSAFTETTRPIFVHETAAVRGQSGSVCFVPSTRSDADVAQHGAFVKKFVATNLIPRLEKKLLKLNTQIAGTRKGLKNQFKTFWGRSSSGVGGGGLLGSTFGGLMGGGTGASTGGDGAKNVSGDSGYSFRSPESEIRLAADLSFALFDHEGAVAHFKLLQADFKADKAFRRLGCSLESAAHALVCAGGGVASNSSQIGKELRKEIEQTFDAATAAHGKAVVSSSGASPKDPASTDALLHEKQEKCAWVTRVSLSHATVRVAFPKSRMTVLSLSW